MLFSNRSNGPAIAVLFAAAFAAGAANADSHFEQPLVATAAELLPANIVKGPNHSVRSAVHNDGFLYIYDIDTKYGPLRAVSTPTLYKRISELNAMAGMEQLKGTTEFADGLKNQAGNFVKGGVGIVAHPVKSVSGAVSGVASIFKGVGGTMHYGKSDTESGRLSVISGFDKTKREYASEFDVDMYSRNKYLQDELTDISRAGFLGSSIVRLGGAAATGGAGIALTVTGTTQAMKDLLREKSAADLRVINADSLTAMGVGSDLVDLFLGNRNFTLTQQTAIVFALKSMSGTTNRAAFIKFAALTDNDDMAAFRRRQAEMYAGYSANIAPIATFESAAQVAVGRNQNNVAIFCAPLDYILWTQGLSNLAGSLTLGVDGMEGITGKELWLAGNASPATAEQMTKWGWNINERSNAALSAK